jgi:hypothetical protein
MDMRFLNTNVQCFKEVKNNRLCEIIREIPSVRTENGFAIGKFFVAIFVNGRGSAGKLDFKIRLTKLENNTNKQKSKDLKDFSINFKNDNIIVDQVNIAEVQCFDVPKKGEYLIKVLVKEKDEEKYHINSLHVIKIV